MKQSKDERVCFGAFLEEVIIPRVPRTDRRTQHTRHLAKVINPRGVHDNKQNKQAKMIFTDVQDEPLTNDNIMCSRDGAHIKEG